MEIKISKSALKTYLNYVSNGFIIDTDIWIDKGIFNTLNIASEIDYSVIPQDFDGDAYEYIKHLDLYEKVYDFLKMMGIPRHINKIEFHIVNTPEGKKTFDFGY